MSDDYDLHGMVPNWASETSISAASKVAPYLSEIRKRVYLELFRAGSNGLTDYELSMRCDGNARGRGNISTYRSRRKELCDFGLVMDSGLPPRTHAIKNDCEHTVWVAVREFDPTLVNARIERFREEMRTKRKSRKLDFDAIKLMPTSEEKIEALLTLTRALVEETAGPDIVFARTLRNRLIGRMQEWEASTRTAMPKPPKVDPAKAKQPSFFD